MKIGILTFHCAHNYGAVLQAYALQETLKIMGHEVVIIDYRQKYVVLNYSLNFFKRFKPKNFFDGLKYYANSILMFRRQTIRYKRFEQFIQTKLNLSNEQIISADQINPELDVYIFGSDQIWNPKLTHGFDKIYFGEFKTKNNAKRISYAASMETGLLTQTQQEYISKQFERFDAISVRESNLKELLQPLTSKIIKQVVDPVLLLNREFWDKIAIEKETKQKYVLVYQVRTDSNVLRIANDIARQKNWKVIKLVPKLNIRQVHDSEQCASPEEFLGWFKNAGCVVTTSFHGTIFSLIFNRPFYTIKLEDGSDSRSFSLLQKLKMEDRFIAKSSSPLFSSAEFEEPNKRLEQLQNDSIDYLKESIN